MTLDELISRAPFLYHATRAANLAGIAKRGALLSPNETYRLHGRQAPHRKRSGAKGGKTIVPLPDGEVCLSDHDRLHEGNIRFEAGWNLNRFIEHLDGLVFFWPGDETGPIKQGLDHLDRYVREGLAYAVMRAPTVALVEANGPPKLSSCNSGAPRHNSRSGKQPRGASTFRGLSEFSTKDEIVEVVFMSSTTLPASAASATSYSGPWESLNLENSQHKD